MSDPPKSNADRNAATLLALIALMGVAIGLLFLTGIILPQAFGVVAVVCGLFFIGAFHYVVWGWWLPKMLPKDEDDADSS